MPEKGGSNVSERRVDPVGDQRFELVITEDLSLRARLKARFQPATTIFIPVGGAGGLIYDVGGVPVRSNQSVVLIDTITGESWNQDQLVETKKS